MCKILLSVLIILSLNFSIDAQNKFLEMFAAGAKPSVSNFHEDIYDSQGNYSSIPVSIIKGNKSGPVFTIVSGVHGYEYPPIVAAQELIQEVDPALLSGTLVIIPLANPNAFYSRTPFLNPQDDLNLNRVFPGSNDGTITERIANYITTEIIANTDVFIDIHGGDANEDLLPFVCYYNNQLHPEQTQKAKRLAESSGFGHIVSYPYNLREDAPAKYGFKQAVQNGKIALSIECGKLGNVQKEAVDMIKHGVLNMLAETKMYPIEEVAKTKFVRLDHQVYIKSKDKGIFDSDYSAGDKVVEGDIVGYTKDEFGNIISEILAPHSGIILYKIGTPPVNINETLMCIAYSL